MKCLVVTLCAVLGLAAVLAIGTRPASVPEPAWQGQTVSAHLRDLTGGTYQQRIAAEGALAAIGPAAAPFLIRALEQRPGPLEALMARLGRHVSFLRVAPSTTPQLRQRAAEQLAALAPTDHEVIRALVAAFAEKERAIVEEAQRSIRRIGPAAVPELSHALRTRNARVRLRSAEVLADLGPSAKAAVENLHLALDDRDEAVRCQAATSLARVSGSAAAPALCAALKDRYPGVRAAAAAALGSLGESAKTAVPELTGRLKDSDPAVRIASARAIWRITRDASATVPILAAALPTPPGWQAALVLGEIGPSASPAIPALIEALKRERVPRPLRETPVSAMALGQIGPASIAPLIEVLQHPDARVRMSAAIALGSIGTRAFAAAHHLVPLLNDPDAEVRRAATLGLGTIDPARKELVPALVTMANDDDVFLSSIAASTLERIDPLAAAQIVRE